MKKIFVLLIVSLGLFSCSIVGSGEVKLEKRNLENFKNIIVKGNVNVEISQAKDTSFLVVEAQENLFPKIDTKVKGDVLTIKVKGIDFAKSKEIKIFTSIENLSLIKLMDNAKMISKNFYEEETSNINLDNLNIELSGNSNLILKGLNVLGLTKIFLKDNANLEIEVSKGISQEVLMEGNSTYQAYHFFTDNVNIENKSRNEAKIAVKKIINAKIFGDGDISYIGNPKINKEGKGKGKLRTR